MTPAADHFTEELHGRFTVRSFDSIDSTNRYLLDEAGAGAPDGLVAVARHQTAGRGRRGRVWDDRPDASLLFSVLFRPSADVPPVRYAQVVGLAILDACRIVGGFDAALKWPNDVLVGSRKLAGILGETSTTGSDTTAVVVGAGVNLNWNGRLPEGLPRAVSADEAAGHSLDREAVLRSVLDAITMRLGHLAWIPVAYRERCATIGQMVRIEREGDDLVGTVLDVDDDGALMLDVEGDRQVVTVGEAVHLRPA